MLSLYLHVVTVTLKFRVNRGKLSHLDILSLSRVTNTTVILDRHGPWFGQGGGGSTAKAWDQGFSNTSYDRRNV